MINKISPRKKRLLIANCIILLLILVLAVLIWPVFSSMFMPFLVAIILAYLLNPLMEFLERRGIRRGAAIGIIFIALLLIIVMVFMSFVPSLISSISSLVTNLPKMLGQMGGYADQFEKLVAQYNASGMASYFDISSTLTQVGQTASKALRDASNGILANSGQLMDLIIIPLVCIMLLMDKEVFSEALLYLVPIDYRPTIRKMFGDIDMVIGGFIRGQVILSTIAGIATGIAAAFIGLPYAPVIGVIAGVTTMVPYFGPAVGMVIIGVMALLTGVKQLIIIVIAMGIIQVVVGNVIGPAVISGDVGLHPVVLVFSIFFFGAAFGGLGMILAVPLMGAIRVVGAYMVKFFGESLNEARALPAPVPVHEPVRVEDEQKE